jgi:hypothetical protein
LRRRAELEDVGGRPLDSVAAVDDEPCLIDDRVVVEGAVVGEDDDAIGVAKQGG